MRDTIGTLLTELRRYEISLTPNDKPRDYLNRPLSQGFLRQRQSPDCAVGFGHNRSTWLRCSARHGRIGPSKACGPTVPCRTNKSAINARRHVPKGVDRISRRSNCHQAHALTLTMKAGAPRGSTVMKLAVGLVSLALAASPIAVAPTAGAGCDPQMAPIAGNISTITGATNPCVGGATPAGSPPAAPPADPPAPAPLP